MIVFVGAVRHPLNCSDYERVEQLLQDTLRSVCEQTNSDFKIVVVCNRLPNIEHTCINDHVEFVVVNFPPPSSERSAMTGREPSRRDKSTKYVAGILAAQKYAPDYIMIFDTDDYLSPNITEYVNSRIGQSPGWYLETGYIMDQMDQRRVWQTKSFHQICGTSLIIANQLLVSPRNKGRIEITTEARKTATIELGNTGIGDDLTLGSSQKLIMSKLDNIFLSYILGAHRWTAAYYELEPLPFPGAIWNWNTGENHGDLRKMTEEWSKYIYEADECPEEWVGKYQLEKSS